LALLASLANVQGFLIAVNNVISCDIKRRKDFILADLKNVIRIELIDCNIDKGNVLTVSYRYKRAMTIWKGQVHTMAITGETVLTTSRSILRNSLGE